MCIQTGDDGAWLEAAEPAQAAAAEPLPDRPEEVGGEADQRRRGQARRNRMAERLR